MVGYMYDDGYLINPPVKAVGDHAQQGVVVTPVSSDDLDRWDSDGMTPEPEISY